jgi:uncharacterized protein
MRTHSPLVLNVVELLENPGIRREVHFEAPAGGLGFGLVTVPGDLRFDLVGEAIDGGVLIQGTIGGHSSGTCRRCLQPVDRDFEFQASELYRPPTEVWEEGYVIKEGTVDLERMVTDTVALNLDLNPLCRDDCAGLCPRCGTDLNQGSCDCLPAEEGDLRWSALRELRGKLNG